MATMFGRFDIQSEICRSETSFIYKALDRKTNQVVALKTQNLAVLGERAPTFVDTLVAESERTRDLANQNIAVLYGAGEIEGQFCAAMEYIQGNSIATMLARKEGFSIWDLFDICRQMCSAVGYADSLGVVHSSLEPAKIMVQWDGMVKILGYGISNMSLIRAEVGEGLGPLMPYCSPEQIRGEAIDQRSNLFTLGTILYEMMLGRRAFAAADPVILVGQIENEMPASPVSVNAKVHPGVSAVIMKALAKNPAERYQTARDMVEDLDQCKDNGKKAALEPKKATTPAPVKIDPAARAAAAAKFVTAAPAPAGKPAAPSRVQESAPAPFAAAAPATAAREQVPAQAAKAAAAAAGVSSETEFRPNTQTPTETAPSPAAPVTSGARLIDDLDHASTEHEPRPAAPMLSSVSLEEEEPEAYAPRIAVDPIMAAGSASAPQNSFSDIDELPPLSEPIYTPPPEPVEELAASATQVELKPKAKEEEKPRIQPREVAQKAIREIATIPPRLILFSTLGALALILVVAVAVFFHVRSEDDGSTAAPLPVKTASAPPQAQPAAQKTAAMPPAAAQTATPVPVPAPPLEAKPAMTVRTVDRRRAKNQPMQVVVTPAITPGQAFVDSAPQGAVFQMDGKSDPAWITPFDVTGLSPGKHIVSLSKSGYTSEMRSVDIVSGGKSSVLARLSPINALVVVNSTPAGAEITLDGKVTGRVTPAQFAVEKGLHTVLLKKQGYLDETTTAELGPGQNFQYAPALRALGNADEIRTVGKLNKLFGRGADSTVGMGAVSIHTRPRGAQIAINQRMLDKLSPVEIMMGPGNYVVDITLTGFKPLHKVITVEKGGKVAIDEILDRE